MVGFYGRRELAGFSPRPVALALTNSLVVSTFGAGGQSQAVWTGMCMSPSTESCRAGWSGAQRSRTQGLGPMQLCSDPGFPAFGLCDFTPMSLHFLVCKMGASGTSSWGSLGAMSRITAKALSTGLACRDRSVHSGPEGTASLV